MFLADRNNLIDQTRRGDFKYFKDKMTIIKKKVVEENGKEKLVSNKNEALTAATKRMKFFLAFIKG